MSGWGRAAAGGQRKPGVAPMAPAGRTKQLRACVAPHSPPHSLSLTEPPKAGFGAAGEAPLPSPLTGFQRVRWPARGRWGPAPRALQGDGGE